MKLGGKVNFGVLSSEIDVIRAKKGPSASFRKIKPRFRVNSSF